MLKWTFADLDQIKKAFLRNPHTRSPFVPHRTPNPMSFTFGFTSDDISDGEEVPSTNSKNALFHESENSIARAIELIPPAFISLGDILKSLENVRMSFDEFVTPKGNAVFRRQIFDIKHQIMVEDEDSSSNAIHEILIGTNGDLDLKKNVYEGGFKLWECSYDLVDCIETLWSENQLSSFECFFELGCGTALPSCYLLSKILSSSAKTSFKKLILSDFNSEVLRLVTIPNMVVSWVLTLEPEVVQQFMDPNIPLNNDELILTPSLLAEFVKVLKENDLEILLVHGSWGTTFCDLITSYKPDFILTSETIYSLETLPIVLDMLLHFLEKRQSYMALVAAKEYYFGVGGSIIEFMQKLLYKKPTSMAVDTIGNNLGQLKRDIVRMQPEH